MRHLGRWVVVLAWAAVVGCSSHGGTSSSGAFEVALTDEELDSAPGGCAVRGNATNVGNLRAHAELGYEALDGNGTVIGTSSASFDVAPFSNFRFDHDHASTTFSNGLSCGAIAKFRRTRTDISRA